MRAGQESVKSARREPGWPELSWRSEQLGPRSYTFALSHRTLARHTSQWRPVYIKWVSPLLCQALSFMWCLNMPQRMALGITKVSTIHHGIMRFAEKLRGGLLWSWNCKACQGTDMHR